MKTQICILDIKHSLILAALFLLPNYVISQNFNAKKSFYDDFHSLNFKNWNWSKHQKSLQDPEYNFVMESKSHGEWEAAFNRNEYSLFDNKFVVLHFKVDEDMTRTHFSLEQGTFGASNYRRFGVIAKHGKLITEYNSGNDKWAEKTLLDSLNTNQWYILKIGIDDIHGFKIHVQSVKNPETQSFFILDNTQVIRGLKWRFFHRLYRGTAYIAHYSEWEGNIMEPVFYNAQKLPGKNPEMYHNKNVDQNSEYINTVFSANGTEFYFCGGIHRMRFKLGYWSQPENLNIPGVDVMLANDQNTLFFCSSELKPPGCDTLNGKYQLWYSIRKGDSWSSPIYLPPPVNHPNYNQIYPSFDNAGNLYFKSDRPGGLGGFDLYVSKMVNGKYIVPENLGDVINSKYDEGDAYIAPNGSYIIFASENQDESFGSGDLFISFRKKDSTWSKPQNLGPEFNSDTYEYCPVVSPDENFFFYKNYDKNIIFWSTTEFINEKRKSAFYKP